MASKKFNSFSFLLLTIMASVFVQSVVATRIQVSPFCRTARRRRALCNTMINGATNWHDAIGNAINSTVSVAKELQSRNELIAPAVANLSPAAKKSLQGTCKESFQTVIDMLEEGQVALAAGDIAKLQIKLSAALDTECDDELSNFGATFPLANLSKQLTKKVSVCLAITAQNVVA
ncbi:pectinesterase inhibitor-like [Olea europaea subsp. europaea]|uniref:Pectinesterase inhibitor-like n=1 Tax=Olea europaea subsp. europaea TaxID=158383 RepID=A0A8S0TP28_OLEEU|nr:pectinesterase inhibitor-like [Olea europaea subsp. europaea]